MQTIADKYDGAAREAILAVRDSMQIAGFEVVQGQLDEAFGSFKIIANQLKQARKKGVKRVDLIDVETQFLSLIQDEAVRRLLDLDVALSTDDPRLKKAYAAFDRFNNNLRKATAKPDHFDALKTVGGLKPVFRAIEKGASE
jgi:hypothetical protein